MNSFFHIICPICTFCAPYSPSPVLSRDREHAGAFLSVFSGTSVLGECVLLIWSPEGQEQQQVDGIISNTCRCTECRRQRAVAHIVVADRRIAQRIAPPVPLHPRGAARRAIAVRDTLVPLTARRTIWSAAVDVGLTSVSSAVAAGRQMRSGRRR